MMNVYPKMMMLFFAAMTCAVAAQDIQTLSLHDCYQLSSAKSETLGLREQDVRVAEAQYWQAVSGLFPKIHVKGTDTFSDEILSHSKRGMFGDQDTVESYVNVKQPIFNGFREFAAAQAASANKEAGLYSLQRARQLLYLDVADAFYQTLAYEGDLKILQELDSALQERVAELEKRVELGKSRKSELLSARTDLAGARAVIESTKKLRNASKELLAFLIDLPSEQWKLEDKNAFPSVENIETYLTHTGERPDVLAQIQKLRAARGLLSATKGEHWPSVNLEGNYFLYNDPDSDKDWNVAVTVDVPIFEGGLTEAKVREKEALMRQQELNLSSLQRSAEKEILVSYNNFIASAAEFARFSELKNVAEENLGEQKKDYTRGMANNLDVLNAMRSLYNAQRDEWEARLFAKRDWVQLIVSSGISQQPQGEKP
ncbi:MAG: TolC family protein [Verrucomicrobiota bacterium]